MPRLIEFHREFADRRADFEIVAFHDPRAKDFQSLDQKLPPIRQKFWAGNDLPFPILLDATGTTIRTYGINSFPTTLVIDPEGKVVKHGGEHTVRDHLMKTSGEVRAVLDLLAKDFEKGLAKAIERNDAYAAFALSAFQAQPDQAGRIANALRKIGGEYAVGFFLGPHGARSKDKATRLAAATALGDLCARHYVGTLVGLHNGEADAEVKAAFLAAARKVNAK